MPGEVKGFGTMYCGYSAAVRWRKPGLLAEPADHDAVVCVTALYLPIIPLKAYHTHHWTGDACQAVEIVRSRPLLIRALVRPYILALLGLSGFALACLALILVLFIVLGSAATHRPPREGLLLWSVLPTATLLLSLGLWFWMSASDQRDRDIRLILGPHALGSSDPATWTPEARAGFKPSVALFGTEDEVDAAAKALQAGRTAEAMLAARLAVASRTREGELLTDRILKDARVRQRLPELRKQPWRREELFPGDALPALDPGIAAKGKHPMCYRCGREIDDGTEITFYDGRPYGIGCLDGAGGDGFADFVRKEPILVRRAPSPWLVRIVVVGLMAAFAWGGFVTARDEQGGKRFETVAGIAFFFVVLSVVLVRSLRRRVTLGGGELRIGMPGPGIPLDAIGEIRRRRSIFVPIVALRVGDKEFSWPEGGEALKDVERALRAAAVLRKRLE